MPTLEPDRFKEVMRTWAAGVSVVTSRLGDEIHGCTVNSFTSVSLTPPLVTIALAKRLHTYRLIKQSHVFAVNILSEYQAETSNRFAGTARIHTGGISETEERFAAEPYHAEVTGSPVLDAAIAFVDCHVVTEYDIGVNVILLGMVEAGAVQNAQPPLLYGDRRYWKLGLLIEEKAL